VISVTEPQPVFYVATVLRVIDGDTIDVTLDKHHGVHQQFRLRLLEVDTPELRGETKELGIQAKSYTSNWIWNANRTLVVHGVQMDSFGRLLAYVYDLKTNEILNELLVTAGHGDYVPAEAQIARWVD
jgi:micrococcal nuclease